MFKNFYKKLVKRSIDIIVSIIGLICFLPIILILIIVLGIQYKSSPFFTQERPGINEKIFKLFKFKSMNDKKDQNCNLLPYEQRITKIGLFIRKTSLDEIPQLFNVLIGDMSLIGPRPLLVQYLELYNDFQKQRHQVKPGISGWAQVNGRNTVSWDEKFKMDVWYVHNLTLRTDVRIFLLTIKKVLLRKDINTSETLNMAPFMGNN